MKKKALLIALSVLLLAAMIAPAMAQKMDTGVKVGDWFKYKAKITLWESSDPFLPDGYMGPLTLADNNTDAIWYNVTDITPGDGGDNVTFTVQSNWKNGTVTTATVVENVSTANQNIFIIGANLTAPAMVSANYSFFGMMDYPARYLNSTFNFTNPESTRPTNRLEYTIDIFGSPYDYVMLWDRATGMRLYYENHGEVSGFGTPYNYTVVWELEDSSYPGLLIPDLTGPILLFTLMAITVPIVLLHRRKKLLI